MMNVSVSQLKDFIRCPQLAYNAHELLQVPVYQPKELGIGTLFHKMMENALVFKALKPSYDDINTRSTAFSALYNSMSDEVKEDWEKHKLNLVVQNMEIPDDWRIVAIEKVLQKSINLDITLVGTLDGIVLWNGKYWSLQWKTYTKDLDSLTEKVRLGWHEVAYQVLAEHNGYLPWGGTILGAVEKLPSYRMRLDGEGKRRKMEIDDFARANALKFRYLMRRPEVQQEMSWQLEMWLHRLSMDWHARMRNYDMCHKGPGRSACPYFDVCHNGRELTGAEFAKAVSRY